MEVRIYFSRPGFFTTMARNIPRIDLTDKPIIGEPKTTGNLLAGTSYPDVLRSVELIQNDLKLRMVKEKSNIKTKTFQVESSNR